MVHVPVVFEWCSSLYPRLRLAKLQYGVREVEANMPPPHSRPPILVLFLRQQCDSFPFPFAGGLPRSIGLLHIHPNQLGLSASYRRI